MVLKQKEIKKIRVGNNVVYDRGTTVDFLLVGGGGGSGSGNPTQCIPGGGGGGGVIQCFNYKLGNGTYGIEVGKGGGLNGRIATNGGNTSFNGVIAYGGGGGGSGYSCAACGGGCPGGSGGGGSGTYMCSGNRSCGGAACSGQGYPGGKGYNYNGCGGGGGGGGAGGPGCDASAWCVGHGGPGIYSDMSGICLAYGGGGSGGYNSCVYSCQICQICSAQGGVGGGGGIGTQGRGYYYGGGGGGFQNGCGGGYQGIFILRYPTECGYNITGGCKYIYGSNTVHCFTQSGFLTVGDAVPKGVYTNTSLGLITLSDGNGGQMTIADKNLGATTVWNWNDTVTAANSGCFYQRGNNYGFPWVGSFNCVATQVNASAYGPGNYYSAAILRINNPNWDSSNNNNLWGGETGTVEARQGPTPSGFHIPSKQDWVLLNCLGCCAGFWSGNNSCFAGLLHLTKTGMIGYGGSYSGKCCYGYYWTTDKYGDGATYAWNLFSSCGTACTEYQSYKAYAMAIRPFKNEVAVPDSSRTKVV